MNKLPMFPWSLAVQQSQLWLAVPQVIALRTTQLLTPPIGARAHAAWHREAHQMSAEKWAALAESWWAMQAEFMRMAWQWPLALATGARWPHFAGGRLAERAFAPAHRRVRANVRRLRRRSG